MTQLLGILLAGVAWLVSAGATPSFIIVLKVRELPMPAMFAATWQPARDAGV
jgi:hypothetical protein